MQPHAFEEENEKEGQGDRTVKKCEFFFYESSESSSVVSMLLTATRAVCIIYFAAHAAPRIFPSLYFTD